MEIILNEIESKEIETTETKSKELDKQYIPETDYNKLDNKPSINGVALEGNKTTKDLGIKAGSDIELITKIEPEDIEEDLKENQVYNGNAIHDLARLFGMTIEELTKTIPQILTEFDIELTYEDNEVYNANAIHQLLELFVYEITMIQEGFEELYDAVIELYNKQPLEITGVFTLSTQKLTNISHYYEEIKTAYDEGRPIKLTVTIGENGNQAMADLSIVDVVQSKAFFYPIMRTNIGYGNQIYFFDVEIGKTTGKLTSHVLNTTSLGE